MFDLPFGEIFAAWRGVAHVMEWTGLSLGGLIGCGAALYFAWQEPFVRHVAIALASLIIAGYGGVMVGNHIGRADVKAEWDAANVQAKKDADKRDMAIAKGIAETFDPMRLQLQTQEIARQAKVASNDPKTIGGCGLSPAAFALRQPPAAKRK